MLKEALIDVGILLLLGLMVGGIHHHHKGKCEGAHERPAHTDTRDGSAARR